MSEKKTYLSFDGLRTFKNNIIDYFSRLFGEAIRKVDNKVEDMFDENVPIPNGAARLQRTEPDEDGKQAAYVDLPDLHIERLVAPPAEPNQGQMYIDILKNALGIYNEGWYYIPLNMTFRVVDQLPSFADADANTMYILRIPTAYEKTFYYSFYLFIDNNWQVVGSTAPNANYVSYNEFNQVIETFLSRLAYTENTVPEYYYPYALEASSYKEDPSFVKLRVIRCPKDGDDEGLYVFLMRNKRKNACKKNKMFDHYTMGWRHPYNKSSKDIFKHCEWNLSGKYAKGTEPLVIDMNPVAKQFVRLCSKDYWRFNNTYYIKVNAVSKKRLPGLGFAVYKYNYDNNEYERVSEIVPVKITFFESGGDIGVSSVFCD